MTRRQRLILMDFVTKEANIIKSMKKTFCVMQKAYSELSHPRDTHGRWTNKDALQGMQAVTQVLKTGKTCTVANVDGADIEIRRGLS